MFGTVVVCMADLFVGTYIDRRTNRVIDCRKTIWILASNLGEQAIARFYETSLKLKRDGEKATTDLGSLIAELRTSFQGRWGVRQTPRLLIQ
jgi:ATP-dependent Clp protease ATP-binding subunit ClpA